jgi:hypothetical protein
MKAGIVAVLCGVLFGIGLAISDMINPARVLAFLDVAGQWDPSLALVMLGALVPSTWAYRVRQRMQRPLLAQDFRVPANRIIDRALITGAILFGIGWGLVGLCPGPAIAGLVSGQWPVFVFVGAMLVGMLGFRLTRN